MDETGGLQLRGVRAQDGEDAFSAHRRTLTYLGGWGNGGFAAEQRADNGKDAMWGDDYQVCSCALAEEHLGGLGSFSEQPLARAFSPQMWLVNGDLGLRPRLI